MHRGTTSGREWTRISEWGKIGGGVFNSPAGEWPRRSGLPGFSFASIGVHSWLNCIGADGAGSVESTVGNGLLNESKNYLEFLHGSGFSLRC